MFLTRDRFAHCDEHARYTYTYNTYTGQTSYRTFVQWWSSVSVAQNARTPSLTNRLMWKTIHLVLLKVLQPIFFCVEGKDFLAIVVKYSGWPVITPFRQRGVTSAHVIRAVKGMMMEKGIPVKFHSDGGPQFASREFSRFCESWGITHVRSSPPPPPPTITRMAQQKLLSRP